MDQVSSQQFPQVYEDLGIDTNSLGCIMVDIEPIEVSSVIDPEDLYFDPEDTFAQGIISEDTPHVTLLQRPGDAEARHDRLGWLGARERSDNRSHLVRRKPGLHPAGS